MAGSDNPQKENPGRKPETKPAVTTFNCGNCGASVSVRYPGHSLSVICESCRSVIDSSNPNFRILQKFHKATRDYTPRIELGSRGELFGKTWEVIGFLVRTDKASAFSWEEYLLFNPYYGYRWLTYNNFHWSLVTMTKERPEVVPLQLSGYRNSAEAYYQKERFKLFYEGRAFVSFVMGEFYWRVKSGHDVDMADYICPPRMLSSELDGNQKVWSVSEYLPPDMVPKAFNIEDDLPPPIGVAPHQPSPLKALFEKLVYVWVFFLFLLTYMQFAQLNNATNETVFSNSYTYVTNSKSTQTVTTPVFTLERDKGNLAIDLSTDVDNAWFYFSGELCADDDDTTYAFERTIEYYHGYSDGEYWTEGSRSARVDISAVPGGKYYINFDTEHGDYPATTNSAYKNFQVQVRRNVPIYSNYFLCIFLVSVLPVLIWIGKQKFEAARWSESDYSPWASAMNSDD
mgnify:CR=1 FL=1